MKKESPQFDYNPLAYELQMEIERNELERDRPEEEDEFANWRDYL